jgi:hypothetical protein
MTSSESPIGGARKRVIFEEVARTLDISGGEQLVSEFYAQLSKFSTWIINIVQQYSRFQRSGTSGEGFQESLFLT